MRGFVKLSRRDIPEIKLLCALHRALTSDLSRNLLLISSDHPASVHWKSTNMVRLIFAHFLYRDSIARRDDFEFITVAVILRFFFFSLCPPRDLLGRRQSVIFLLIK